MQAYATAMPIMATAVPMAAIGPPMALAVQSPGDPAEKMMEMLDLASSLQVWISTLF
jgi:hypothetical protein